VDGAIRGKLHDQVDVGRLRAAAEEVDDVRVLHVSVVVFVIVLAGVVEEDASMNVPGEHDLALEVVNVLWYQVGHVEGFQSHLVRAGA
jgi:hypothetical protein